MAYRPQANGTAERMVQTATRALKMYVQDLDQRDWDAYAERLTFAINTAQDRIRGETPFYLVHGWDPRSTLEATIPVGGTRRQDRDKDVEVPDPASLPASEGASQWEIAGRYCGSGGFT
ncbi:unnamed protein product [Phytophthora fragariaefolia]|uniref:Unnamed protein product n=1 Tax=Phytophthora fragariaefolia TaxID=1490495 RepID=A0A9W6YPD9_9STRA|nr:unnamed protein product [Phytophthora fragariaefolia]